MDCNSYSYTPHMLDAMPSKYPPRACNRVTVERRTANGHEYYIIFDDTNGGINKAYDIDSAIRTAADWIKNGV